MLLRSALQKVLCEKRNPLRSSDTLEAWLFNIVEIALLQAILAILFLDVYSDFSRLFYTVSYVASRCIVLGTFVLKSCLWSWTSHESKALSLIVHPVVILGFRSDLFVSIPRHPARHLASHRQSPLCHLISLRPRMWKWRHLILQRRG